MHIGINRPINPPPYPIPDVDGGVIAQYAEQLGFESIVYGEHPITPLEDEDRNVAFHAGRVPYFQDLLVMMTRAAALTTKLKVVSGVLLIPEHNPVQLAKQIACLDLYSGGRIILGVGTGWNRVEIELLGGNFDRRWGQMREAVQIMKALWTQDRVEFKGEFYTVPPVHSYPQPASKGGPPVLLGGSHPNVFKRIAAYGDGWLPAFITEETVAQGPDVIREKRRTIDELAAARGRDPGEFQITAILTDAKRDLLAPYEDASTDRVAFCLPQVASDQGARDALERIAEAVL